MHLRQLAASFLGLLLYLCQFLTPISSRRPILPRRPIQKARNPRRNRQRRDRKHNLYLLLIVLALFLVGACRRSAPAQEEQESRADEARMHMRNCSKCHIRFKAPCMHKGRDVESSRSQFAASASAKVMQAAARRAQAAARKAKAIERRRALDSRQALPQATEHTRNQALIWLQQPPPRAPSRVLRDMLYNIDILPRDELPWVGEMVQRAARAAFAQRDM